MTRTPHAGSIAWIRRIARTLALLCLAAGTFAEAGEPLKVICAARVDQAPVIDGRLDDAGWQRTEVRDDFTQSDLPLPLPQRTTLRALFDDRALYLGIEYFYDNGDDLKKWAAETLAKQGTPPPGPMSIRDVSWAYNMELFVDPGATQLNYYQIMVNAIGQYTGNFKAIWDAFDGGHSFKSTIEGSRWTLEFVYPYESLNAGDEWGLNLVRNDRRAYAIWTRVGAAFHEPKKFGRLVFGNYEQWWHAVWAGGVQAALAQMPERMERHAESNPGLMALLDRVQRNATQLDVTARQYPPDSRESFERLYAGHAEFRKDFNRLQDAAAILDATAQLK